MTAGTAANGGIRAALPSSGILLPEIDGMRAFAAFTVLMCHALLGTKWAPVWLIALQDGGLGVEFFFVLSGFLLFLPFASAYYESRDTPSLKYYAVRRVLRILPAYYISLGLVLLFVHPEAFATGAGRRAILAHLTMTFSFSLSTLDVFNPVYWTLAVEEQFYFLLPIAALLFCRRLGRLYVLLSLVASHLFVIGFNHYFPGHEYLLSASLPFRWDAFAFGILVCLGFLERRKAPGKAAAKPWVFAPLAVAGIVIPHVAVALQLYGLFGSGYLLSLVIEAFGYALLLWATLLGPRWLGFPWRWKPVRYLGLLTYSMYLWHWQVSEQVRALTTPPTGPRTTVVRIATVFLFTVIVAGTSYFLVEKPFMALRKRFKEPGRSRSAGAAAKSASSL